MGIFNKAKEVVINHQVEVVAAGGFAIGGGVGAYRDDSSFLRGSTAGALGAVGSGIIFAGASTPDKDYPISVKNRLAWSAVGAGMVGLGVGIFNKRKKEN
jgi:hypothetical protein